jgi:hypothetical protein
MSTIKKLEINKIFREFEYLKSEFEYKSELVREADSQFLRNIDNILNKNIELKEIYESKVKNTIYIPSEDIKFEDIQEEDSEPVGGKLKSLYRQIAKLTHPDKVSDVKLNQLYIESTRYYVDRDIIGIYKICDILSINYEVEESDINIVKQNIELLRERISFIENSYTFKWYQIGDENKRDLTTLSYIRTKLIT